MYKQVFFKPTMMECQSPEKQSNLKIEKPAKNILFENGVRRDAKIKFDHDDILMETTIYVDKPDQIDLFNMININKQLMELSTTMHHFTMEIKLSSIPLELKYPGISKVCRKLNEG